MDTSALSDLGPRRRTTASAVNITGLGHTGAPKQQLLQPPWIGWVGFHRFFSQLAAERNRETFKEGGLRKGPKEASGSSPARLCRTLRPATFA